MLGRAEGDRLDWLEENTRDDPTLAEEVQKLLRLDHESDYFLGETVSDFLEPIKLLLDSDVTDKEFTFPEGTRIGPWRIEKLIGKGGIGQVYLAERDDGIYTKKVALKCIKRGMDSEVILQRFRYERQILASLQHPNIATLFDGGLTADGRPYLVMEFVDGIPIDQYCDNLKLGISERLKLFQDVCRAVNYAHRNLVVHRDLKPSNILVTGQGTVKLLDFGIAKLLDKETHGQILTQTMMPVMTPVYAAPEQIRGETVTTAADVYALGVIIYELMTGKRPCDFSSGSSLEVIQAVLYQEPDSSSVAVKKMLKQKNESRDVRAIEQISSERGLNPERLYQKLRGDIDMIVMKALHKEPDRRYTSAETFLEDINRHLSGLPISARPDKPAYRLQKYIRRHWFGVATAVAFVLFFAGFLAVHTNRVTQERNLAFVERDIAKTERDKANEVAVFLEELLSAGDPAYGSERADTLRLRDFVQLSVVKVRNELEQQPAVKAQMLNTLGKVQGKLGMHEQAFSLLNEALEIRRSIYDSDHLEVAASMNDLGVVLTTQGEFEEAENYLREALDMRLRLSGPESDDPAGSYTALANLIHYRGDYEEAEEMYRKALEILEHSRGPEHHRTAVSMQNLATILHRRGNLAEAEELHRKAISINRNVLGREHPLTAASENNFGLLLVEMGQYSEGADLIRSALDTRLQLYGDEHPNVLTSMNNLASVLVDMGNYHEGEEYYRKSLELRKKVHGELSMPVAIALNNLADLLRKMNDLDEAVRVNREAIDVVTQVHGPNHPAVGIITGNLALKVRLQGDPSEAEQIYRTSLTILENTLPPDHPSIARQRVGLAECLADQSRFEDAESLMLMGYTTLLDKGSDVSSALKSLVSLYEAWDKPGEVTKYSDVAREAGTETQD